MQYGKVERLALFSCQTDESLRIQFTINREVKTDTFRFAKRQQMREPPGNRLAMAPIGF
jgi:hypothetical protein